MAETTAPHYRKPGWFTRNIANRAVARLTRLGVSVWGSRVLEVRGRRSGQLHRVPVNLLTHDGRQYLVSARGEGQWVRNVRAADGQLDLLVGRRREHRQAHEVTDADKVEVLRAYLRRWKAEVGVFFDGVSADSNDTEMLAIAPRHPVFVLDPAFGCVTADGPAEGPVLRRLSPRATEVVAAARVLLEREGPGPLTMRRLAEELDIQAPSIYKHLAGKHAIEVALIELALAEMGQICHQVVEGPDRHATIDRLLAAYRGYSVAHPNLYRLATSGALPRADLSPGLEDWAGRPWFTATGDPHLAQALWSFAHGMVILELDRRYPDPSALDRTWAAGTAAFDAARRGRASADGCISRPRDNGLTSGA